MIREPSETEDSKCTGLKLRGDVRKSYAEAHCVVDFFLKGNFMEYANPNRPANVKLL